jgi:thioredoxin-related protein
MPRAFKVEFVDFLGFRLDFVFIVVQKFCAYPNGAVTAARCLLIKPAELLFFLHLLQVRIHNYSFMKKYLPVLLIAMVGSVWAQEKTESIVKWMTFEEAVEKSKTEKRKIFIDVYTDWCGWCKVMDKNTFTDPKIAALLNEKYYPVKFDAEQTADVVFKGTTFKFVPYGNKGAHQLAMALLNNQMSYPNFVFLDEEFRIIPLIQGYQSLPGYRKPEDFHIFVSYVSGDFYKTKQLQDYQKEYKSPYNTPAPPTAGK